MDAILYGQMASLEADSYRPYGILNCQNSFRFVLWSQLHRNDVDVGDTAILKLFWSMDLDTEIYLLNKKTSLEGLKLMP
jgi:hypothetical protein